MYAQAQPLIFMQKFIIAYVVAIIVMILVVYIETGFNFSKTVIHGTVSTTAPTSSTTSVPEGNSTTTVFVGICDSTVLSTPYLNATTSEYCQASGGQYGVWVAAGNSGLETATIVGSDGKTYLSQSSSYNCTTYYDNITLPAKITYNITLRTGLGGGTCGQALVKLNRTITPPQQIYSNVYNGNFSTATYLGWTATNPGFGTRPFNISYADRANVSCYLGTPWSGYSGNYFATNYNCGLQPAAGNLTSSMFYVNPSRPFLNFRIISQQSSNLYIMVLGSSNQPLVAAHYNSYNNTSGFGNAATTFRNASIPLSAFAGQAVRVKLVAQATNQGTYLAAGDFGLSARPVQTSGILVNITYNAT